MLWICTLYEDEPTPEMIFTLSKAKDFAFPMWIRAGKFTKGVKDLDVIDVEEVEQRNEYLLSPRIKLKDWILVLDSDEILFGAVELIPQLLRQLEEKGSISAFIAEYRADARILYRSRLIQKREGMKYEIKHDRIIYQGENILISENIRDFIECIGFMHYRKAKTMKRIKAEEQGLLLSEKAIPLPMMAKGRAI